MNSSITLAAMRQVLLCGLVFLFALAGCDRTRKQLVGKWKAESGGSGESAWEFFDNGTLSAGGSPGRYTFGDNNRLKIQTTTATFVYQFEFSGDRMTWKDPNGSRMELTRIK